jgi:hypothetical protein
MSDKNIGIEFTNLTGQDISDLSANLLEAPLDTLINSEILRNIPVLVAPQDSVE